MLRLLCLFTTLLLSPLPVFALGPVDLKPLQTDNMAGCAVAMTGSATYSLSNAITGTTSAAIDLGAFGCFAFSVTATAGGQPIRVWQSNNSTTYTAGTTVSAGTLVATALVGGPNQQACYSFTKMGGRYIWFDIPGMSPALPGPNYVTPTASRYSVWYYLPTGSATSGAATIVSGTVTANQGTSPWVVTGNVSNTAGTATIGNVGITNTVNVVGQAGTATIGNVGITNTVNVFNQGGNLSFTAGTATVGNVGITNTVNANSTLQAGTAFVGSVSLSQTGQIAIDAKGSSVNASGFNFLSMTVMTGITTNADVALSLTWAASTSVAAPLFVELNCSGATGVNYVITASSAVPAGWVANSALFGYQPCGQISQIPLEVNGGNTPHLHTVASVLSAASASVGVVSKQRP